MIQPCWLPRLALMSCGHTWLWAAVLSRDSRKTSRQTGTILNTNKLFLLLSTTLKLFFSCHHAHRFQAPVLLSPSHLKNTATNFNFLPSSTRVQIKINTASFLQRGGVTPPHLPLNQTKQIESEFKMQQPQSSSSHHTSTRIEFPKTAAQNAAYDSNFAFCLQIKLINIPWNKNVRHWGFAGIKVTYKGTPVCFSSPPPPPPPQQLS